MTVFVNCASAETTDQRDVLFTRGEMLLFGRLPKVDMMLVHPSFFFRNIAVNSFDLNSGAIKGDGLLASV